MTYVLLNLFTFMYSGGHNSKHNLVPELFNLPITQKMDILISGSKLSKIAQILAGEC